MNLKRISLCAAVLATVLLTPHVQAADNLHFYGNLLSKSCTLVVQGETLAEVHFPTISRKDLMVTGQSARVPVVFQLKDCKGPAQYEVRVTLTGTEDSEQPGFWRWMHLRRRKVSELAWKKPMEHRCRLTIPAARPLC